MAFKDTLKNVTNKIADGTTDAVGTVTEKVKIGVENKKLTEAYAKLGKIYYEHSKTGEPLLPEAEAILPEIREAEALIAKSEGKIQDLKDSEFKVFKD